MIKEELLAQWLEVSTSSRYKKPSRSLDETVKNNNCMTVEIKQSHIKKLRKMLEFQKITTEVGYLLTWSCSHSPLLLYIHKGSIVSAAQGWLGKPAALLLDLGWGENPWLCLLEEANPIGNKERTNSLASLRLQSHIQ